MSNGTIIRICGIEERRNGIYYEIDTKLPLLGEGGMGRVYKGTLVDERKGTRKDVAIKSLLPNLPPSSVERAKREALMQFRNDNLVEMYGYIETSSPDRQGYLQKRIFIISEYLDGVLLSDLLNHKLTDSFGNGLPFADELHSMYVNDPFSFSVLITKNILSGVMALHDAGYVHRDIDPSNIMITRDRKIKLFDFGIAKTTQNITFGDRQLTQSGMFMGKANYAAPELVLGDLAHQNVTTDIYAIGIILFQLVTGHVPFCGTMMDILEHQQKSRLPLKDVKDKRLRRIIDKATNKKQANRYQSASEFRVAIDNISREGDSSWQFRAMMVKYRIWILVGLSILAVACVVWIVLLLINSSGTNPSKDLVEEDSSSVAACSDDTVMLVNVVAESEDSFPDIHQPEPTVVPDPQSQSAKPQPSVENDEPQEQARPKVSEPTSYAFPYGNYEGKMKDGKPSGHGKLTYSQDYEFNVKGVVYRVSKGDYLEGSFYEGKPQYVKLYKSNGEVQSINFPISD